MQRLVDMSTSELIQFAGQHSASIKEVGIYSELMKELTTRLGANTAAVTQALNERDSLNQQVVNLAVENASLLPKAASELSNAWMLNKYWVGIQVALMHVNAGRLHDGMTWLQNTVSGPGIEAPELSDFAEIEAWANEQQKDSIGHVRALEIIKAASPATNAAIANIQAQGADAVAAQHQRKYEELLNVNVFFANEHNEARLIAECVAAELRKEAGNE
ncbi:hypothetical protein [Buttiauxella agrestis]|uniref:hypothetical protein n=1 Tax=Buttiauxella agrestis TaxID=82977 RepID=UPI00397471F5